MYSRDIGSLNDWELCFYIDLYTNILTSNQPATKFILISHIFNSNNINRLMKYFKDLSKYNMSKMYFSRFKIDFIVCVIKLLNPFILTIWTIVYSPSTWKFASQIALQWQYILSSDLIWTSKIFRNYVCTLTLRHTTLDVWDWDCTKRENNTVNVYIGTQSSATTNMLIKFMAFFCWAYDYFTWIDRARESTHVNTYIYSN